MDFQELHKFILLLVDQKEIYYSESLLQSGCLAKAISLVYLFERLELYVLIVLSIIQSIRPNH